MLLRSYSFRKAINNYYQLFKDVIYFDGGYPALKYDVDYAVDVIEAALEDRIQITAEGSILFYKRLRDICAVDESLENNIKLILSAGVPYEQLFPEYA